MKISTYGNFLALGMVVGSVGLSQGADWPQFRGPLRDAHSAETGLLHDWPKEGPTLVWQSKEAGGGFSAPAIVGGKVYLVGSEGIDHEYVLALSAADGHRLWSANIGKVGNPDQKPTYPGSRSTPTVDGNLVFALGSDGDLACLEAGSGKEKWHKHLRNDLGGKPGEWAYAESPLVDGEAVVCAPGGKEATVVALSKKTGAVLWKSALPEADDAGYASIVPAEIGGVKQYIHFLAKGLAGIDARTGKLLWRYERSAKGTPAAVMTPLVSDGSVYAGSFMVGGGGVKVEKKGEKFEAEELYFNTKLPSGLGGVVKVGDYFYGTGGQTALCVDFKTGAIKWEERSPGLAWLAADGQIYAHADNGDVLLIEPSAETLRIKSRFTPAGRTGPAKDANALSFPALADGKLYVREQGQLWCYNVTSAK